jgi:TolB-like protein/Flp pilus assembly protein TadD
VSGSTEDISTAERRRTASRALTYAGELGSTRYKFGPFELDPAAYQLCRDGVKLKLEHQAMDLLICLVERRGGLVNRQEIVDRLWGRDVFVDVEAGIHTAVRKIRKVLDEAESGIAYVETVARKGYCFAAAVTVVSTGDISACVAVLPVEPLDSNPDSGYLADGITEELIAALGQVAPRNISVIGRTTMMRYKGARQPLAVVAKETGASFLVESSLRSDATSIRLVSRLIEASSQTQLWCHSLDGERRESVLALQRELSSAVAAQVHAQLAPEQGDVIARRQTSNPAAYDLYLRGRYLWHQLSADTTKRALEHFQRATTLDSNYALAWAGMAVCFAAAPITGDASSLQVMVPARNALAEATRSDPSLAETHTAAGFVQFWLEWDYVRAEESFRRAVRLDPSDSAAHRTLAVMLAYQHRGEEAEAASRTACELDPLNAANFSLAAQVAFFARKWPEAAALARRAIQVDPTMWVGHLQLAQALERLGQYDEALQALQRAGPLSANNSKIAALQGYIYGVAGRTAAARQVLDELAQRRLHRFVPPYADSLVSLGSGDLEQAVRWLEQSIEVHDVHLSFLLADAKWDPIRERSPWFQQFLSRCGFHLSS